MDYPIDSTQHMVPQLTNDCVGNVVKVGLNKEGITSSVEIEGEDI